MNYPKYVIVDGTKYEIRTDFRIALKCNKIAEDDSIGDLERALAIICTLFGEEALDNASHYEKLKYWAVYYLTCGKDIIDEPSNEPPDMDFEEDMDFIEASFMSDYHIDLATTEMHWWKFYNLISGLSNSDMGNCCILNRIRNLRTYNTKEIKDKKERKKIEDAKRRFALKKYQPKKAQATEEQRKSAEELYKALGL